jgi:hypothetical protein
MGADPPVIVSRATMTVSGDRPETPPLSGPAVY